MWKPLDMIEAVHIFRQMMLLTVKKLAIIGWKYDRKVYRIWQNNAGYPADEKRKSMMIKKNLFVCFIAIIVSCMLMACGNGEVGSGPNKNTEKESGDNNSSDTPTAKPTEAPSPTPTPEPIVIGDEIVLGSFDQEFFHCEGEKYGGNPKDKSYINDGVREELVWKVLKLSEDETKAMIITRDVIAFRAYHDILADITWEECSLRKWLNEDFYNSAFTEEEKAAIKETLVVNNNKNEKYDTVSGNDTTDRIYCLSIDEAIEFYGGKVNDYNNKLVAKDISGEASMWWLRGNGRFQKWAIWVSTAGLISAGGTPCDGSEKAESGFKVGVRPVMWVDVAALHK